jgi:uncharacterized protein (TIGR02145 family)
MKRLLGIFILMILLLTGLTTCSKEEPISRDQELGMAFFLTTDDINYITCANASSGGYIIDNVGGSGVLSAMGVCWSTTPNPTTADNKTMDVMLSYPPCFHSYLTGLNPGITYYVRAYATNSEGTFYGNEVSFTVPTCTELAVSDIDGNIYKIIQIGIQTWMAENLKTTRYNDGSQIPYITDLIDWAQLIEFEKFVECPQLTAGAYYWFDNNSSNKDIYGAIYNWYAVDRGNLCPTGWHVPTDAEWTKLAYFLGGTEEPGGKLKETGTTHWLSPNTGATNESGFKALPGAVNDGYYGSNDWWLGDYDTGMYGLWWSASDYDIFGIYRSIINLYTPLYQDGGIKNCGASVRCLKD